MILFTIDEPIFKTATLFVLDCSFAKFAAYMQKRWHLDVGEFVGQSGQMFTFVRKGKARPPFRCVWAESRDARIVFHETFHLVTRICADRGIPIVSHHETGECGDEAAAFLFEFYVSRLIRRVRK